MISRIGLFGPGASDFGAQAREAARILRPGGVLSLATWTDVDDSPYTRIGLAVLRRLGAELPDFAPVFAASRQPEKHLAGFERVEASWFEWSTEYPSFDDWWHFVAEFGPLKAFFAAYDQSSAQKLMMDELAEFVSASGSYRLPARARVVTAQRRP